VLSGRSVPTELFKEWAWLIHSECATVSFARFESTRADFFVRNWVMGTPPPNSDVRPLKLVGMKPHSSNRSGHRADYAPRL
jgi:hypothetical protein